MKRIAGMVLAAAGGAAVLWGGYHVLTGESAAQVEVPGGVAVSALTAGLVGLLVCTLGFLWLRD